MVKGDKIDPICGMKGHIKAHGHYFCSQGCADKFKKQIDSGKACSHCSPEGLKRPWFQIRLYQVVLILAGLFILNILLLSVGVGILNLFWLAFHDYLLLIWWAIILGFFIGGIIEYLIPGEYISKMLSKSEKRTIGWSVVLGFLMSACSHGILAISMELYKKGASVSSVVAFLLASPWANLPITILLLGFFGVNAIYFILTAILIALITGFIYQVLERRGLVEKSKYSKEVSEDFSIQKDMKKRFSHFRKKPDYGKVIKGILNGSWDLSKMVLWWILIGISLASLARVIIQPEIFAAFLGPTLMGIFLTLILATVIEVCSEGSSPLAFEIYLQTGALGNSFTFLMAGVATDYTEIGLIASNIGRKAAFWLPVLTVPQIIIFGILFNLL